MKVITLSEVAIRLRQRRQGRGYIGKFINECTIEDAITLDKVKQVREEIEKIQLQGVNTGVIMQKDVLAILDKLIAESEG